MQWLKIGSAAPGAVVSGSGGDTDDVDGAASNAAAAAAAIASVDTNAASNTMLNNSIVPLLRHKHVGADLEIVRHRTKPH